MEINLYLFMMLRKPLLENGAGLWRWPILLQNSFDAVVVVDCTVVTIIMIIVGGVVLVVVVMLLSLCFVLILSGHCCVYIKGGRVRGWFE